MSEITELINKLVNKTQDNYFVGEVTAVDGVFCDVMPADGTAELKGIRLCAEDHASKFIIIPVVGSIVYVTMDSETGGIVTGFSEVDEVYLRGDAFGGLVKVSYLVSKLNALENKVNAIITAYNAHVHTASNTPTVSLIVGTLTPTINSDIENTKVKHG